MKKMKNMKGNSNGMSQGEVKMGEDKYCKDCQKEHSKAMMAESKFGKFGK